MIKPLDVTLDFLQHSLWSYEVSNHTVKNSKIGYISVVCWICIVDSHPVIKKSLAVLSYQYL